MCCHFQICTSLYVIYLLSCAVTHVILCFVVSFICRICSVTSLFICVLNSSHNSSAVCVFALSINAVNRLYISGMFFGFCLNFDCVMFNSMKTESWSKMLGMILIRGLGLVNL